MIKFIELSLFSTTKDVTKCQIEVTDCDFGYVRIWLYIVFLDKTWSLLSIEAKSKSTKLFEVINHV